MEILEIGDYVYFNMSHLGTCDECSEDAFSYDENGTLLCVGCLEENHANGVYDDQYVEDDPLDCDLCGREIPGQVFDGPFGTQICNGCYDEENSNEDDDYEVEPGSLPDEF